MSPTTQQFFLRWNNYVNHLAYAFDSLRTQEDFVDVTLSCEGRKIRAHKVILSACSTYFREAFQENPCQHPVIIFKNVRYDDLMSIIEFIYQGEVNVLQESLSSFLHTAEMLSIQGLTDGVATEKVVEKPVATPAKVQTSIVTRKSGGSNRDTPKTASEAPVAKKKRFYIDAEENVAIENIDFGRDNQDSITIEDSNVMKIEIPEYIDLAAATEEESAEGAVEEEVLMEEQQDAAEESPEDAAPQLITVQSGDEETYTVEAVEVLDPPEPTDDSKNNDKSQHDSSSKWSQCKYCNLVITTVNLWRHVRTQHTSQPPRKCEVCMKSFKNKYSLREHIRIAHETHEKNTSVE